MSEEDNAQDESAANDAPGIDFNTFVLSLSTSALMHLGAVAQDGETPRIDLPMARQSIDCLAMLEEKTKGNLTGEEERLLNGVVYDLRIRYVAATKQAT